ncbi:hypothetical protein Zmor_003885 [Zophobas morio]|uniref:Uncharacterized protein n=1 Tax=Zophobas morio TaxID=2755281 RepID=A0AA38HJP3_9CUCU|nr:hypothetical protein Zmor_003885 [Zophobas morio]
MSSNAAAFTTRSRRIPQLIEVAVDLTLAAKAAAIDTTCLPPVGQKRAHLRETPCIFSRVRASVKPVPREAKFPFPMSVAQWRRVTPRRSRVMLQ